MTNQKPENQQRQPRGQNAYSVTGSKQNELGITGQSSVGRPAKIYGAKKHSSPRKVDKHNESFVIKRRELSQTRNIKNDLGERHIEMEEEKDQVFQLHRQLTSNMKQGHSNQNNHQSAVSGNVSLNGNISNYDKMSQNNNFSTTTKSKFNTID